MRIFRLLRLLARRPVPQRKVSGACPCCGRSLPPGVTRGQACSAYCQDEALMRY